VGCKSSSSGDCGDGDERTLLATEAVQFGSEMAAPLEIEDANWHRSEQLHKECGWKRGDSTIVKLRKGRENRRASRWSAISHFGWNDPKLALTGAAFSWKCAVIRAEWIVGKHAL